MPDRRLGGPVRIDNSMAARQRSSNRRSEVPRAGGARVSPDRLRAEGRLGVSDSIGKSFANCRESEPRYLKIYLPGTPKNHRTPPVQSLT